MGRSRGQDRRGENNPRRNTDGMTRASGLEPQVRCDTIVHQMNGAQCAQYCVLCTFMCATVFMLFIAFGSSMMLLCVKLYAMS